MSNAIDELKARIRSIGRDVGTPPQRPSAGATRPANVASSQSPSHATAWTLGDDITAPTQSLDRLFAPDGLDSAGIHEVRPAPSGTDWPAAWTAARSFALALAVRRLLSVDRSAPAYNGATSVGDAPPCGMILWCATSDMTAEFGIPYGPGLHAMGLDPACLIVAEPARRQDVLWTLEQGLKSAALALVVGQLDEIGLTPARRLSLAAARTRTPCLLLTHPNSPPAAATATRWRIATLPSAPHPFDPEAPGAARFSVTLERCRSRPLSAEAVSFDLEWCDAAFRFRLASDVADRALAPDRSRRRAMRAGQ